MTSYFDSIYSEDIPGRAKMVYMYLVQRANSDGQCWPSEKRIALDLSISKTTAKRAISDLVSRGYISVEQRYRKCGAKSSLMFTITNL